MHTHTINAATSIFPGCTFIESIDQIYSGVEEYFGKINTAHIQLCPQSRGHLSDEFCAHLLTAYPDSQFRLHANVKIEPRLKIIDLSDQGSEADSYFKSLAYYSKQLNSPLYSLHAGYKANCSRETLIDRIKVIEDWFGVTVAVEGGYPNTKKSLHLSTWEDHAWLLEKRINFVIDLSHLNIIRNANTSNMDSLVKELLDSSNCREIHVSSNNGNKDSHLPVTEEEWWSELLENSMAVRNGDAQIFSEGNQLLAQRKVRGNQNGK